MIKIKKLKIKYNQLILEETDFDIPSHSLTLIKGESGSGKTSLLYRLALISENNDFEYYFLNEDIVKKSNKEQSRIRKEYISFITQDNMLFEHYDVLGNLKVYSQINNKKYTEKEYVDILSSVDFRIPFHQSIDTLSGGQKQRLAIACAICKDTPIIILDEPTSALDIENTKNIFKILSQLAHQYNKTIIISSHSEVAKDYADQIYEIKNKKLIELKHSDETKNLDLSIHKGIALSFGVGYIRYFLKKYKFNELVLLMIVVLSLLVMNLSMMIIQNNTASSIQEYQTLSNNQMFISQNEEYSYIDQNLKAFQYNNNGINYNVYPYLRTYVQIGEILYPVIPIYDDNEITKNTLLQYNNSSIYISYSLHQSLVSTTMDLSNIYTTLMIEYYENNQRHILNHNTDISIGGVLNRDTPCYYLKEQKQCVYIDYDILKKIYETYKLDKLDQYVGYTLVFHDFDSYVDMYQNHESHNIGMRLFFPYITEMQELTKMNTMIEYFILGVISIITLVLFNVMEIQYFFKRQKELIMLKINGMNNIFISQLIFVEMIIQCLISFILNCIFLVVCTSFFDFVLFDAIIFNILIIVLLLISAYTLIYVNTKGLSVEEVLRY